VKDEALRLAFEQGNKMVLDLVEQLAKRVVSLEAQTKELFEVSHQRGDWTAELEMRVSRLESQVGGGSKQEAPSGPKDAHPPATADASPVDEARCANPECGHTRARHVQGADGDTCWEWMDQTTHCDCDAFRPAKPASEVLNFGFQADAASAWQADVADRAKIALIARIRERVEGLTFTGSGGRTMMLAVLAILSDFEREVKP
jgi:hypothetical protein